MRSPPRGRPEPPGKAPAANDRLKAGWGSRLAWSITASVGVHAALLALWPSWAVMEPRPERSLDAELEWIVLQAPATPLRSPGVPAAVIGLDPDSLPAVQESEVAGGEENGVGTGLSERLRERLRGGTQPAPRLAEPVPELEPEERVGPTEERPGIGGDALAVEIPDELEGDSLDLGRLATVRPELALVGTSAWIRVRNPSAVNRFMRRVYDRGELDPGAAGSVGLTLWIDERGSVEWAEITDSSGRPEMDRVALALFNEVVTFEPARDEGIPVSAPAVFWVSFPWF